MIRSHLSNPVVRGAAFEAQARAVASRSPISISSQLVGVSASPGAYSPERLTKIGRLLGARPFAGVDVPPSTMSRLGEGNRGAFAS